MTCVKTRTVQPLCTGIGRGVVVFIVVSTGAAAGAHGLQAIKHDEDSEEGPVTNN